MSTNFERTKAEFGYDATLLKPNSRKLVYVTCDYCGEEKIKKFDYLKISRAIINKDACIKCKPLKTKELHPTAPPEALEKRKKTNLERYGSEHYYATKDFKEKSKQTCKEKYGVENAMQSDEVKNNLKQTFIEKFGVDNPSKHPEVIAKIKSHAKQHNGKTCQEWASELGIAYSSFMERKDKYGVDIAIKMTKGISSLELKMAAFLDELKVKYVQQYRVDKQFADFFLPDHKLVIECDGLFWHSDYNIKDNSYHYKKKQMYEAQGFGSLFFREDEINNKFDIVKSIILNKLGLNSRKIFARKCKITTDIDSKDFLEKYHLMGNGRGQYFALTCDNEVLCVMQVKKVNNTTSTYEISRFCTLPGVSIIGGYSKLLSTVEKTLKPSMMVNFIDRRYGCGNFLPAFGFSHERTQVSFKWATKDHTLHRMTYPSNTGYDAGYAKIWDCGQARFVKHY